MIMTTYNSKYIWIGSVDLPSQKMRIWRNLSKEIYGSVLLDLNKLLPSLHINNKQNIINPRGV